MEGKRPFTIQNNTMTQEQSLTAAPTGAEPPY